MPVLHVQQMLWTARTIQTNYAWMDCSNNGNSQSNNVTGTNIGLTTLYTYCAYIGFNNMMYTGSASTYSNLDVTDASYAAAKQSAVVYTSNLKSLAGVMVGHVLQAAH
jgi:hypothetical protein